MAVGTKVDEPVLNFEIWYDRYEIDEREGCLDVRFSVSKIADSLWRRWDRYKREMDMRVGRYENLEKLADGEVVSTKPDLPNISSGETAGLIRRTARNLVQNTPNVEVISTFDDDSPEGILVRHLLLSRIIGSDLYSNDMQQNLFASTKTALTLGFDCVIPLLLQDAGGSWYMKYDAIHYRDVFPEPGARDVRQATDVFVRRYLTEGEVKAIIADSAYGWDHAALRTLLKNRPPAKEQQSVDRQTKKHHQIPEGYEIITWYSSTGEPFLTFSANTKMLLRIEKNKHPMKKHPVHFLVLEKDSQQPLGKSQVELLYGRQEFQDLMLNGAMKLWYRNINPSIIGYGAPNTIPNLSPGKYTQISNPNARVEPFEINTGTLQQYGLISQQNLGSMISLLGTADQQMATQSGGGMSATPQGVEAQQALVDITTNNYQKAIEAFFSQYCSYALTIYFQELKTIEKITPTAEARKKLFESGFPTDQYDAKSDCIYIDFGKLAVEYWVRCVPGSLTELEDEKQLRILNQLFVPLSQMMPALAAAQDQEALAAATKTLQYIMSKEIELSGSQSAKSLGVLWGGGDAEQVNARDAKIAELESSIGGIIESYAEESEAQTAAIAQMQEQISLLVQNNSLLLQKLGVENAPTGSSSETQEGSASAEAPPGPTVLPASA